MQNNVNHQQPSLNQVFVGVQETTLRSCHSGQKSGERYHVSLMFVSFDSYFIFFQSIHSRFEVTNKSILLNDEPKTSMGIFIFHLFSHLVSNKTWKPIESLSIRCLIIDPNNSFHNHLVDDFSSSFI